MFEKRVNTRLFNRRHSKNTKSFKCDLCLCANGMVYVVITLPCVQQFVPFLAMLIGNQGVIAR